MAVDREPGGPLPTSSESGIPYKVQYALTILVSALAVLTHAILLMKPAQLGLGEIAFNWVVVIDLFLAGALALLPRLQKPPAETRRGMD